MVLHPDSHTVDWVYCAPLLPESLDGNQPSRICGYGLFKKLIGELGWEDIIGAIFFMKFFHYSHASLVYGQAYKSLPI